MLHLDRPLICFALLAALPVLAHGLIPPSPVILGPREGEARVGPVTDVWGTAAAFAAVEVHDGAGAPLCAAFSTADGTWRCTVTLPRGNRKVAATASSLDQVSASSAEVSFVVLEDVSVDGGGCSSAPGLLLGCALLVFRRR